MGYGPVHRDRKYHEFRAYPAVNRLEKERWLTDSLQLTNQRQLIVAQFGFTEIQTTLLGCVDGVVESQQAFFFFHVTPLIDYSVASHRDIRGSEPGFTIQKRPGVCWSRLPCCSNPRVNPRQYAAVDQ